ncbi:MAG TPA: DoxX family protein [Acidimicrobiales bacterium]|nr:DoxX family protein [Acidimicrobiales bacterium]
MTALASILSIALFLAFVSTGVQKIRFNPLVSASASRLGYTKRAYQRLGALEVLGGIALMIGLSSTGSSLPAIVNDIGAAGLTVMMGAALVVQMRRGDGVRLYAWVLGLGVASLLELIFRLVS